MDGKKTGWQVCKDTAADIRKAVARELHIFGHLSADVVARLRNTAKEDFQMHDLLKGDFNMKKDSTAKPKR